MPAPTITPLPDAPLRSQAPATFTAKAEAFVDALEDLPGEINAFAAYLDTLGIDPDAIPELARDAIATALVVGAGLAKSVDDGSDTITIKVAKRGFSFQILGTAPTADEPLATWTPPSGETVTFADDFAGCVGKKIGGGTDPASSYALVVKKNGSDIGTITISTSGVVTFATTGTTVELIGGTDTLTIYGATAPDTAVGYAFTMAGDLA